MKDKLLLIQPTPPKRGPVLGRPIWILEAVYLSDRVTWEVPVLSRDKSKRRLCDMFRLHYSCPISWYL